MHYTIQKGSGLAIHFATDSSMILRKIADKKKMSPHQVLDEILELYIKENEHLIKQAMEEMAYQQVIFNLVFERD